jgi:hypothetical protein
MSVLSTPAGWPSSMKTAPRSRSVRARRYVIAPGHDAWVVGDERFVGFEFESRSAEEYAKG